MPNPDFVLCPVEYSPPIYEASLLASMDGICPICNGDGYAPVAQIVDFIEQQDIELPDDFMEPEVHGREACAFCHGSGDVDHGDDWSSACLYCHGEGLTGPIEAELIRRELARSDRPMEPKPAPEPKRGSRLVHNFSTFDTGEIGIIVQSDDPTDGPYFWYLVDPGAHNMQGEVIASGRCNGIEHGTEVMHSAIMGFVSKLNATRTPDATFDAPYVPQ